MPSYATNFGDALTDSLPADWEKIWNTDCTWQVEDLPGRRGGKVMRASPSYSTYDDLLLWDDVETTDTHEVLALGSVSTGAGFGVMVRALNVPVENASGYGVRIYYPPSSSTAFLQHYKVQNGLQVALFSYTVPLPTHSPEQYWYVRVFCGPASEGGIVLKSKAWSEVDSEPDWMNYSYDDPSLPSGSVALIAFGASTQTSVFDYISVGTGGETSTPDPQGPPAAPVVLTPAPGEAIAGGFEVSWISSVAPDCEEGCPALPHSGEYRSTGSNFWIPWFTANTTSSAPLPPLGPGSYELRLWAMSEAFPSPRAQVPFHVLNTQVQTVLLVPLSIWEEPNSSVVQALP